MKLNEYLANILLEEAPPTKQQTSKIKKVMKEFGQGKLHSGTGKKGKKGKVVTDQKQAVAIAYSTIGKQKKK